MLKTSIRPFLQIIIIATLIYSIHKFVFSTPEYLKFSHSIEALYGFFCICSLIITIIVLKVKQISIDNTGFAFIAATFVKIAIAYFLIYPILNSTNETIRLEKINFLIIFGIFSTLETYFCTKILNKS